MTLRSVLRIAALALLIVSAACVGTDGVEAPASSIEGHDCFDQQRRGMVCDGTERYQVESILQYPDAVSVPIQTRVLADFAAEGAHCTDIIKPNPEEWSAGERSVVCLKDVTVTSSSSLLDDALEELLNSCAVHLATALMANADVFETWNTNDFAPLVGEVPIEIREPTWEGNLELPLDYPDDSV